MVIVDWAAISEHAASESRFHRTQALTQAVTELERAMKALNARKGKWQSWADVLLELGEANQQLEHQLTSCAIPKETLVELLRQAINARNEGVHSSSDVQRGRCECFVEVISIVWQLLRDRFVSRETAARLASSFVEARTNHAPDGYQIFSDVFLFGSLARDAGEPNDIDLLLIDALADNDWTTFNYSSDHRDVQKQMLRDIDRVMDLDAPLFASVRNEAAVDCGWLNLTVVPSHFLTDPEYARDVAGSQSDPLFFVNLAGDALRFQRSGEPWKRDFESVPVFEELAAIRNRLYGIGFLPKDRRREIALEIAITVPAKDLRSIDQARFEHLVAYKPGHLLSRRFLDPFVSRKAIVQAAASLGLKGALSELKEIHAPPAPRQRRKRKSSDIG